MALPALVVAGVVGLTAVTGTTVAVVATAGETAVVQRVVDGDTFDAVAEDGREIRVRLLNVDTPETKDPNAPVECLGPEATARLAQLLPPGSTVTLDRDVETVDGYGRELAGVTNADGVFVNEDLARQGLGIPMLVGSNDRFHGEVLAANAEARAAGRGLYAGDVTCTLPGQVQQMETAPGTTTAVASTPEQYDAAADQADAVAARARGLLATFDGPRIGRIWSAFSRAAQDALRARVQAVADRASQSGATSRSMATTVRERAAAERRAQEEAARREEQRRQDEAEAQAQAEAEYEAHLAESRRRAAGASSSSSSSSPSNDSSRSSSGNSSASSGSAGAYPGYTGPRCYAPGGRTWRPC
jgi:micrococcal nuclease